MARPSSKSISSQLSGKHQLIDKANSYLIISSVIATVLVVFSIFASIELIDKISYQNQVIGLREDAKSQLDENLGSIDQLNASYIAFESAPESIIGTADKNSKIILDALPSKYDFPAFVTSLDFLIKTSGMSVGSIGGSDQEIGAESSSINPIPSDIPYTISATGNYESAQKLVQNLQRSIRPFKIDSIDISGEGDSMTVAITGVSYYQPSKELGINEQVVKSDKEFKLKSTSNADSTAKGDN